MNDILNKLGEGDYRSIGKANEVVNDILRDEALFAAVFHGMLSSNGLIRMRSADVVEKVTRLRPYLLQPFKELLLTKISMSNQQEVRWHFAQMSSRLILNKSETELLLLTLVDYTNDKSRIVVTSSIQAIADIARRDNTYKVKAIAVICKLVSIGSPAVINRGRKLLLELQN